jgi:hypothetical protein
VGENRDACAPTAGLTSAITVWQAGPDVSGKIGSVCGGAGNQNAKNAAYFPPRLRLLKYRNGPFAGGPQLRFVGFSRSEIHVDGIQKNCCGREKLA